MHLFQILYLKVRGACYTQIITVVNFVTVNWQQANLKRTIHITEYTFICASVAPAVDAVRDLTYQSTLRWFSSDMEKSLNTVH